MAPPADEHTLDVNPCLSTYNASRSQRMHTSNRLNVSQGHEQCQVQFLHDALIHAEQAYTPYNSSRKAVEAKALAGRTHTPCNETSHQRDSNKIRKVKIQLLHAQPCQLGARGSQVMYQHKPAVRLTCLNVAGCHTEPLTALAISKQLWHMLSL